MATETRKVEVTVSAGTRPLVDVRNLHGTIRLRGEDRIDVQVRATLKLTTDSEAEADEMAGELQRGIRADGGRVHVHYPRSEGRSGFGRLRDTAEQGGRLEIDYEIAAPSGSSVELSLVNGTVAVQAIEGRARIRMVNGNFEVQDIGQDVSMQYVNAGGSVRRTGGQVHVHYTNGGLEVVEPDGEVSVHVVNGRVEVKNARAAVNMRGVSGTYILSGPIGAEVKIWSGQGSIRLDLPEDSRFELDAKSTLGSVTSELDVRDGGGGRGRLPRVRLRSEVGSIELRKLREPEPAGV